MRQNFLRMSALFAVAVAACSEPTGINQGLESVAPRLVVTSTGGQLTILSGDNRIQTANQFTKFDPAVRVVDANGAAVAGASVVFTTVEFSGVTRSAVGFGGDPAAVTAFTQTVTTNDNGVAVVRWVYKAVGGQSMTATSLGATVTFNGIATATGTVPTINKIAPADETTALMQGTLGGEPTAINPTIRVMDGGTELNAVLVNFTPNGDGKVSSATARTNSSGYAAVVWTVNTTSTTSTLTASISAVDATNGFPPTSAVFSVTHKVSGTMALFAGSPATATTTVGSQFGTKDPAVRITTSAGAAIAGVPVKVTYDAKSKRCGAAAPGDYEFTNDVGVVAVTWCNNDGSAGSRTITFTTGTQTVTITGTVSNNMTTSTITKISPAGASVNTGAVNTIATPDLTIELTDANGVLAANQTVTFTANMGGSVAFNSAYTTAKTVTTDANGRASVRWLFGTAAGTQTVTVSRTGATSLNITGTATPGSAAKIYILDGDGQTGTKNTNTPKNPSVKVTDEFNNTILGTSTAGTCDTGTGECVNVTFAVTSGGGTVAGGGTSLNVLTGQHVAGTSATTWKLGATAGSNTLKASIPNGQFVTFTANGQ